MSSGEVEATYWAVGPGGKKVQTAIDHWLVSEELADRVDVEAGPGANGMGMQTTGTQTQASEEDGRGDAKGHNSLLLKLRLDTRAAEGDDADEGWEKRQVQTPPFSKEEWQTYIEEEAAAIRKADEDTTVEGEFGNAGRRLAAMEQEAKQLAEHIKELHVGGDDKRRGKQKDRATRLERWMLDMATADANVRQDEGTRPPLPRR